VCAPSIPPVAFHGEPWCSCLFALFLQLDEWVLCRLYNKKNNWEKVKVEKQEPEAAAHHHRQSAAEDSMSDSFQTHDSDIDNASGGMQQSCFGNMVQGQAMAMRNGIGTVTVKEDNDWFTDLNLDDLQASYNMAHMVNPINPVQTVNLVAGQGHGYLQSMSSPSMKMWQTILPPF